MKLSDRPVAATPPLTTAKEPIFTRNFLLICFGNLFTFGSFHVLLATLPIYIVQVGGRQSEVGLVMSVFAITSLVTRPFVGRAADMWGRKRFLVLGGAGMALSPLLYIASHSILPLTLARLLQGAAFGALSTALSAALSDVVPPSRRGEAVGYYGMFNSLAMASGPAMGVLVMTSLGSTGLFVMSATIGLMAFAASVPVREPARQPRDPTTPRPPLVVRAAIFPSSVFFCFGLTYGALVTFLPLFAVDRGLSNPGLFFTVQALVMLAIRSYTGRLSDRFGRGTVAIPGLLMVALSMALISRASSLPAFLSIAAFYAVGMAGIQPSLMALVMDRVRPEMRGAAMGTFISSMDAAIGVGALLWGLVADLWGYPTMFLVAAAAPLIGVGIFLRGGWR